MITRIPFQGLKNTRDLGGKPGAGGRKIRERMLLRGEALSKATPEDVRRLLNDYRLRLVVDLRMGAETEKEPDPVIPGVNDTEAHFEGIGRLTEELPGLLQVDLLPYHPMGNGKRAQLGLPPDGFRPPAEGEARAWQERLTALCRVPVRR